MPTTRKPPAEPIEPDEGLSDDELDALADRVAERMQPEKPAPRARAATREPPSRGPEDISAREMQRIAREETEAILSARQLKEENAARDAEIARLKAEKEAKVERKPSVFSGLWRFMFGEPTEPDDET